MPYHSWFDDNFFDFRKFQKEMQRAMKTAFKNFPPEVFEMSPSADMSETDKHIIVKLDMPGITKKDIEIYATPDALEVKAERKSFVEEAKKSYYRRERGFRAYRRVLHMPVLINPNKIKADYKDGVLTLTLEKKEKKQKKVKVKVK